MNTEAHLHLNHELYGSGSMLDARFYAFIRDRAASELRDADWSTDPAAREEAVATLDPAMVYRNATMTRLLVEVGDAAAIVAYTHSSPRIDVAVAAASAEGADGLLARLREVLSPAAPDPQMVDVDFWTAPGRHPMWRRQLEMVAWDDVRENYHPETASLLDALHDEPRLDGGKLVLWHGEPGTGKTHALRAVMARHVECAEFHYVTDPEHFFGDQGDYMLRVLLSGAEDDKRWKLVILEDAGELLAFDARERVGQALSRLLNACDGLVGQGLRLLVLITTNEDVGKMHPAVTRPGRCLSNVAFRRFEPELATMWLKERGVARVIDRPHTIAELYSVLNGGAVEDRRSRFGF